METELTAVDYIVVYVLAFIAFIGFGCLCALVYRWAKKGNDEKAKNSTQIESS
jgi:hypothetical protein